jgi:RNA polymerase sigma factor (sigma-70 family)
MMIDGTNPVLQTLRRVALYGGAPDMTDGQLLGRFVERRDEAAFEALVRRHGPMVLGVCRRLLRHGHDAEDAFQAVFIVLARKAASVRQRDLVGSWLYSVAYQTALKARRAAARRQARERQMAEMPEPVTVERDLWGELLPLLDRELHRLPDKYRIPIVLCELEGLSHREAAGRLGCAEGTVSSNISRARAVLAKRLSRFGLAVTPAALAAALSRNASAAVPPMLVSATVKVGMLAAAGSAVGAVVSTQTAALANSVTNALYLKKVLAASAVLLAAALAAVGAGAVARQFLAADPGGRKPAHLPIPTASPLIAEPAPGAGALFARSENPGARLDRDAPADELASDEPADGRTYLIINAAKHKCISVVRNVKDSLSYLTLGPPPEAAGAAAQWRFSQVPIADSNYGVYYQFINVNSGHALTISPPQNQIGSQVLQIVRQRPSIDATPAPPGQEPPRFNIGGFNIQTRVEDQMWQLVKTKKGYAIRSYLPHHMALGAAAQEFGDIAPIEQRPLGQGMDQDWMNQDWILQHVPGDPKH